MPPPLFNHFISASSCLNPNITTTPFSKRTPLHPPPMNTPPQSPIQLYPIEIEIGWDVVLNSATRMHWVLMVV